jgi:hypothetical protein
LRSFFPLGLRESKYSAIPQMYDEYGSKAFRKSKGPGTTANFIALANYALSHEI